MALRKMTKTGRKLAESDIASLEKKLKNKLPAPYREFLLQHNGGRPEPRYIRGEVLHYFYSVDAHDDIHDLWAHCKLLKRDLPAGVIPIAADTFGNSVCLVLKGENRGKVYFWDHEGAPEIDDLQARYPELILNPWDEPEGSGPQYWPGHPELTFISDSFEEFLDGLHDLELEDEKVPAKTAGKRPTKAGSAKPAGKQPVKTKPSALKLRKTRKP